MAKYSAVKATVNAYIKQNGRKEITGRILNAVLNATIDSLGKYFQFAGGATPTDDPGTPDQNVCYLAGEPGVYTNFGGITIENEEVALLFWDGEWTKQRILIGIREVNASVDNQVGTPSVDVSYRGGELVLTFHNLKGEQGDTGDPAGFGTIGADINGGVGTPGVSVETSGDNTAKNLMFHFTNLKGETGVTSVVATIDNTSGTPSCQVSLVGQQLTLAFSGLKGLKGDTGVSADYPITIYNGLDSDATDQALAAAQGKVLDGKISQLGQDVDDLDTDVNGGTIITEVPIDYMTISGYNALINADNLWTGTTLYPCAIIPVTPGEVYKFVQNDNPGTIAVLKTDTYQNGTTPDFSDSYPGRIQTTDIPDSLTIPSDAHFLYVRKKTAAGDVNLEMYRLDESESEGLRGRIGKVLAVIGENDMSGIYPFYINANTKQWTTHINSITFCYRVFKGQRVTIVPNSSEDASIAFVANMNTKSGDSVQFANGTNEVQIINIGGAETYTMIEDCYLYVFKRGSSVSSNRFPASITIEESEAVVFKKENKSDDNGNWPYYGARPNFKTKRFGQKLLATLPAYSGRTGLHQGMAVYGDYLVLFTYDDNVSPATCTAVLYDIPSETKLAEINLPYSTYRRPHGNALSFGFGFNSENSIVPPLYISQWDEDGERGCLVYDITLSGGEYSATLIQAIIPNIDGSIFGNGYSDWVVDAENGYIYSVVYGLAVNGPYQQNDQTNPTKICKFALPSLSSSEVILTDANIVENFAIRSLPYRQGLCIAGDTLMIQRGNANAGHADWLDVHFVNLAKRAITTVMPLSQFGGETEGIAVYKGKLIMGWRGNARIYEFEF